MATSSRPPLHLRVSLTERCQLRCLYCMPAEGVALRPHAEILRFEEITAFVRLLQQSFDVQKVRLTGGDPLVRPDLPKLVRMLADLQIPDLALTTNGQQLVGAAAALQAAGLQRVNISLDSLHPDTFGRITRGGVVQRTIDGIDAALQANLRPVKLNMVVMRGINDSEVEEILAFGGARGCEVRFLELMPIGCGVALFDQSFVSTVTVRDRLAARFQLVPLPVADGSSARRFRVEDQGATRGIAGFISPCSDPFCRGCIRLRLTADGRIIGCLARKHGLDIRPFLRQEDPAGLADQVRQALQGKRSDRDFAQPAVMATIGG